jgi:hypothetical protein
MMAIMQLKPQDILKEVRMHGIQNVFTPEKGELTRGTAKKSRRASLEL